ncbi:MAG: hypothetical protein ACERKO_04670 [Acetanaerobacterium sp.]
MKKGIQVTHYIAMAGFPVLSSILITLIKINIKNQMYDFTFPVGLYLLLLLCFVLCGGIIALLSLSSLKYMHKKSYKLLLILCAGLSLIFTVDINVTQLIVFGILPYFAYDMLHEMLPAMLGFYCVLLIVSFRRKQNSTTAD